MAEQKHPIEGVMETAMKNLKDMIDVNTIIGDPINTQNGTVIIPVSKVSFGFASGGSDFATKAHQPPNKPENLCFGGGSGAGITINPIAFLVVTEDNQASLIPVDKGCDTPFDKVVDSMPDIFEKIKSLFPKKKKDEQEEE